MTEGYLFLCNDCMKVFELWGDLEKVWERQLNYNLKCSFCGSVEVCNCSFCLPDGKVKHD